jgi:hypothetical protein
VFADRRGVLAPGPLDVEGFAPLGQEMADELPDVRFTISEPRMAADRRRHRHRPGAARLQDARDRMFT